MSVRLKVVIALAAIAGVLAGTAAVSKSATDGVPFEFQAGTPARAAEVNANFQHVLGEIDLLGQEVSDRVDAIEDELSGTVTKWIPISVYGTHLTDAGRSTNGAIGLPDDEARPTFAYGFVLPEDYVAGTDVVLEITWMAQSTFGDVWFRHGGGTVYRLGQPMFGLLINDPASQALPVVNSEVLRTELLLNSVSTLEGDAISHFVYRDTQNPADSATAPVLIGGLRVRYTGQR